MAKATILLVNNDPDFLESLAGFLRYEGYQVIPAQSVPEARSRLRSRKIDLAIIDIHLEDDDDLTDLSGESVARSLPASVPKIIFTRFRHEIPVLRKILRLTTRGEPSVVRFISRQERSSALVAKVESLLRRSLSGDSTIDAPPPDVKKKKKGKGK